MAVEYNENMVEIMTGENLSCMPLYKLSTVDKSLVNALMDLAILNYMDGEDKLQRMFCTES